MKKKEVKKVYAPLVSEETYDFSQENAAFLMIAQNESDSVMWEYRCPNCGKVHKEKRDFGIQRRAFASCPYCGGNAQSVIAGACNDVLQKAKIFRMADGSMAISLIAQRIWFMHMENDMLVNKMRTWRARIVFNKNGHTYFKAPVFIKSKRKVRDLKPKNDILDVTYSPFFMPHQVTDFLQELTEKGILKSDFTLRHRFQNASEQCLDILKKICQLRFNPNFKEALPMIRSIQPGVGDLEIMNAILAHIPKVPKTKQFRRMFYKDPMTVWTNWKIYQALHMKDINSFYKFCLNRSNEGRLATCLLDTSDTKRFAYTYIHTVGETAFADILADDDLFMFWDVVDYASRLGVQAASYMHRSLKKTHDDLMEAYRKSQTMTEQMRNVQDILYWDTCLSDEPDEDYKKEVQIRNMRIAEQTLNNTIEYSEEERSLEYTYNDIVFYLPPDTDHLLWAGDMLHNCVGHCYRINALHHESVIVLMKQQDKLVGCIEVNNGAIRQAYGPCNRELRDEAKEAFESWKQHNGFGDYVNRILNAEPLRYQYDLSQYHNYILKVKELAIQLGIAA